MFSFLKSVFVVALASPSLVQAYSDPGACSGACWAHDPSVIQRTSDGLYFKFNTGSGIQIATSSSLSGPWTLEGYALSGGSIIDQTGNTDLWAPDVHKVGSLYYMYYAVSTFGSQTSTIGLATSSTMDVGSWTDLGSVGVASTSAKPYNAIDPNLIAVGSDYYLNFGSFWHDIYQAPFNSAATKVASSAYNIEYDSAGTHPDEGSYMFYYSGYYYLLWSNGICCNYDTSLPAAGAEYKIKMCRSTSATGGFVDKSGVDCTASGGTILLESHGTTYGPGGQGVFTDTSKGLVLYYHYADTDVGLGDASYLFGWNVLKWSSGWPEVGFPELLDIRQTCIKMSKSLTFALQALLMRHEQYMQDAERDRLEMNTKIERLENDKRELEDKNARTIEENRALLEQLEGLNTTVADSETHIKSLEATLQSTRQELRRLELLACRTQDLEIQLAALEQEQDVLQRTVTRTEAEERSAIQRWKKAERQLYDLHEQLERIEREAREERERHVEVIGRMERQRAVERELDTAAGRLKAAAATTGNGKNGSNVVSYFVKDILQDNANLQMGIMELREMLMNSNDEVQALREQLMLHQPLEIGDGSDQATLRAELAPKQSPERPVVSQALHIHHHYHAPKKEEIRRPKKKRTSLNNALFTPPKINSSPRTPRSQETANAILSQTSVTIPTPITPSNRWSMQSGQMSDFAPSSVPSSPQSMYRNSMLFDRGFDVDSSRPTSPGSSVDPMSPQFQPFRHRKRGSEVSTRSFAVPINFQPDNVIHEEDGDVEEFQDLNTPRIQSLDEDITPSDLSRDSEYLDREDWNPTSQPKLRRTASHESILSISGIDIHTLKSRPSQLTIRGGNALLRPPSRLSTPTSIVSVDTMVTAHPTISRIGQDSSSYLRSSMRQNNSDTRSINSSSSGESPASNSGSLGGKLGGWVFSRWGVSPDKSSEHARPVPSPNQNRTTGTPINPDPLMAFGGRLPGINQKGPVPGFVKKVERAPSRVTPQAVDHDALREVLVEVRAESP
ncbi:hypothetical protein G7Y89_g9961 [Cudoniella acicularis]|uniref:Arabinan endo-1,5-alpha-L-arabinosidase n=1 Tax=Cudoniella acicularis TaxID=354080 RepID=A0A8H4RHC5_9HELO|nr:hypothetical protein G7Y89_g9961 [Cudoniella acicularis]